MKLLAVILSIIVAATPLPTVHKDENSKETVTAEIKQEKTAEKPKSSTPTQTPLQSPPVPTPAPAPKSNEQIAWEFLVSHGYTREQAAGIMGNLRQEHNFNTSDVPGGLGIAQWMGNRRDNLMARANYLDINVQLQFMLDELNGGESAANNAIKASTTVEQATLAFSGLFERCGICMNDQRIQYAYDVLARY